MRDAAPRLAYLIPDFQNPTGGQLDAAGRQRLVELARRTGTTLVIDETLAELNLDVPAQPPVAAHGAVDSPLVLTVGSVSKVFWGGLRVGWIRTSAAMVRRLAATRAAMDLGGPILDQLVVARLLGDLDSIVAARRVELTAARDHVLGPAGAAVPGVAAVPARRRAEPVDRPGGAGRPAGSPGPRGGAMCCSPPVRGSAWTGRSSGSCGCRTRWARSGWTPRWTGWPWPGGRSTGTEPAVEASPLGVA